MVDGDGGAGGPLGAGWVVRVRAFFFGFVVGGGIVLCRERGIEGYRSRKVGEEDRGDRRRRGRR